MSRLEGVAVLAIVEALQKIGETFLDGDRKDDFGDVVNALLDIFGLGGKEEECEEKQ